jgi:two-component system, OmpR family, sensor kinase
MPLRMRLALLFALATAVAVAVAGAAFVLQLRVSVDASLDPGLRTQLADVADGLSDGDTIEQGGKTTIVQVLTPDGQVLVTSPAAGAAPLLTPVQRQQARTGEVSFTTEIAGDRTRVLAAAVERDGGPALVAVGTATDVSDVAVERAELAFLVGGPGAVLLRRGRLGAGRCGAPAGGSDAPAGGGDQRPRPRPPAGGAGDP